MNILPNGEAFKPEGPQPLLRELPPSQPFPEETLGPLLPAVRAVQSTKARPGRMQLLYSMRVKEYERSKGAKEYALRSMALTHEERF